MNRNKFLIFIIILYYSRLNAADVLKKQLSVALQNALSMLKDKSINTWKDWCLVGGASLLTLIVFWFLYKNHFNKGFLPFHNLYNKEDEDSYVFFQTVYEEINNKKFGGANHHRSDYFFSLSKNFKKKAVLAKCDNENINYKYKSFDTYPGRDIASLDIGLFFFGYSGLDKIIDCFSKYCGDFCMEIESYIKYKTEAELNREEEKSFNNDLYVLSEIYSYQMVCSLYPSLIEIFYNFSASHMSCLWAPSNANDNEDANNKNKAAYQEYLKNKKLSKSRLFVIDKLLIADKSKFVASYMFVDEYDDYIYIDNIATRKQCHGLGLAGILLNELNKFNKPQLLLCSSANEAGKKCYTKSGFKSVTVDKFLREKNVLWKDIRETLYSGLEKKHVALEDYVFLKGV